MTYSKRVDPKIVKDIIEFRERMAQQVDPITGKQPSEAQIIFAQVQAFKATAREHADATFPLEPNPEIRLKYWTQTKRRFNVDGDRKKLIIGVWHTFQTIGGKLRKICLMELATKGPAGIAKKHQDILNKGGLGKSRKLQDIENDPQLKIKHQREYKALMKRLRRR